MKHAKVSRAWRPVRASHRSRHGLNGVLIAFAFNLCLFALPVAGAIALLIIARDHLYAYEYSDAGSRVISSRVERLNGDLIQLDFDRQRQWDDLVAMELMAGDTHAARGFLLSAGGMLPSRMGSAINRIASDGDGTVELAALELLTPGTRARYESTVPLLSRRAASGAAQTRLQQVVLGDAQDFELMARSLLTDHNGDALQFILTGLSLNLAGEFTPREANGAAALLAASRRENYPAEFDAEISALFNEAVSMERFRTTAMAGAEVDDAGAFANAAAAFRVAVNPARATQAREALDQIGAMAEAVSPSAAADLVSHAQSIRDLPRLRLLAQATGDRAAAAAKRLPRDGDLLSAARGQLTLNRDLVIALTIVFAAFAGLLAIVLWNGWQASRRFFFGATQEEDYESELVDLGGASNWRPL